VSFRLACLLSIVTFFQDKKHGSGDSDQKKVMVKVGNKTKTTGGTGGKRSVASASLVSGIPCIGGETFALMINAKRRKKKI
jgi:hypothetical protein